MKLSNHLIKKYLFEKQGSEMSNKSFFICHAARLYAEDICNEVSKKPGGGCTLLAVYRQTMLIFQPVAETTG